MSPTFSFLVMGAGAWGSALAIHLARRGHHVVLWGHSSPTMDALLKTRRHEKYLPNIPFPENIALTSDLKQAFELAGNRAMVLLVVPSSAFEQITQQLKPFLTKETPIIWGTKGLSEDGELFHVICRQNCGPRPLSVLSGPSFAMEVARGLPTATTIATESPVLGEQLVNAFHSEMFRVYLSSDLVGVELGGAIKNVLAIAVGMSDGLGFGANARAALITRGLAELCRLGEKMGAQMSTMMGLSGVGDIVLTCTDNQSRNRRFGLALGQGKTADEAERAIAQVVEGKMNVKQVMLLAGKQGVELPICQQVYSVLYEGRTPKQAVMQLLTRPPKIETA
ncbi:MAG: NAD(P)H-dependent glycerol-3-phosphate dehydrogenase [Candidatus Berkiellales bacterium]